MELTCERFANGGDAIARHADGRVVFVEGALPGERVEVEVTQQKKDFARARVLQVLEPSNDRVVPSCEHVAQGCGGCAWQHVSISAQINAKRELVIDALKRIGKIYDVGGALVENLVRLGPSLDVGHHRTSVRVAIEGDRAGYRKAQSKTVVSVQSCLVADPVIEHILANGRFALANEVSIRRGLRTGQVLIVSDPTADGIDFSGLSLDVIDPSQVTLIGLDELPADVAMYEIVANEEFRISADSFFQTRTDGAEALVAEVERVLDSYSDQHTFFDLYGGVGLFAATVGKRFDRVISVENNAPASLDAQENLRAHKNAIVIAEDVDRFDPTVYLLEADRCVVVADPARSGLGEGGVRTIAVSEPEVIVLISCEAASLGRDAFLLRDAGYQLAQSVVIDLFPHTPHVEVVSVFVPADR
jgi:23S rRNA (uracil1939-C5)-methyltransferase